MINGEREALGFRSTSAAGNMLSTVILHTHWVFGQLTQSLELLIKISEINVYRIDG